MPDDNQMDLNNGSRISYLQDLKQHSPMLYSAVAITLGIAAAYAIYLNILKTPNYAELFAFIAFAVFCLALATLLHAVLKHPVFKLWFATFVVLGGAIIYLTSSLNGSAQPGSIASYPTILCWTSSLVGLGSCESSAEVKEQPASPSITQTQPQGDQRVFIQFAGFDRKKEIIPFAQALVSQGWNVQDAARGGERTEKAIGKWEIRFFHDSDLLNASRLANAMKKAGNSASVQSMPLIKRLSGFDSSKVGTLEIWMSP